MQEVLCAQQMTRVPKAPEMVEGLINLRGQIVTALDMRRRLGLPPRPSGHDPMNVVLKSDEGAVSLLVDAIGDVIEVSESSFEPTPESLPAWQQELIRGVYKLNGQLMLVLAEEKVLEVQTGHSRRDSHRDTRSYEDGTGTNNEILAGDDCR